MTDKPHITPADPSIRPEGYEPPTSAEEQIGRHENPDGQQLLTSRVCSERLSYVRAIGHKVRQQD